MRVPFWAEIVGSHSSTMQHERVIELILEATVKGFETGRYDRDSLLLGLGAIITALEGNGFADPDLKPLRTLVQRLLPN